MISKLLGTMLQHNWLPGPGLSVISLLLGVISYWVGEQGITGPVLIALGLGWGLSWGLDRLLLRQSVVRPLEQLDTMAETLASKDSLVLAGALDALGRGELTVQMAIQAQPIPLPAFPPLRQLTYAFNQLVTNLHDCEREFNLMTSAPFRRLCFVGPDDYMMGHTCGELMGQALAGQGKVVILVGYHMPPNIGRRRGFERVLRENYPRIEVVGVEETELSTNTAYALTRDFLRLYQDLGGIYITEGASPASVARAVVDAGRAGQVKIVAHDLVGETAEYVAQGVITATVGQSPYTQGHDAVIHLFNHLVTAWRPETPRLVIEPEVVTPENYQKYWHPGGEVVVSEETAARLARPLQPSPHPLRIIVTGSDDIFWNAIWAGVEAATEELAAYNATVEKVIYTPPISPLVNREDLVERAIAGEYHGVVTPVGSLELDAILNRLAAAGVPVVIVNAEQPTSLPGLIAMLGEQSQRLVEVSHELRTPLSLVVGLSEMMLTAPRPDAPPLPDVYRQDLERIQASSQQLKWLIGDVLDLATSQAGQLRLAKTRVQLGAVLRVVAAIGEEMVRAKGLQWRVELPDELPAVWGDRARLQQIILNLLTNACKFTPSGEVRLTVKIIGSEVRIAVSDTGVGIPAAERVAIFEEFRKSKRTAGRGYGGLGLGLAITQRLVNMHRGHIWVESSGEPGQGSTFIFTLPVLAAVPEPAAAVPGKLGHQPKVLLVREGKDDNPEVWQRLQQADWEVENVQIPESTGPGQMESWLGRVLASAPRAVVLDLASDSKQGWTLMQALKSHPAARDVPVVFCAHLPGEAGSAMMELDYLTKPVKQEVLGEALRRYGVQAGAGSQTILIVDDEPELLDLHQRMVESQIPGCRVLLARNGLEALEILRQERPDLVLLDLLMPELDGIEVLEAMQVEEAMRGIAVIVLTAQLLTERDMARLNRGVTAVLSKGVFSTAEVLAQIAAALNRDKRLGSETQQVVRRAMAYIHEHYAEPISREDMARYVGVHENYLSRCFHQEAGLTPIGYLNRYRIKQAKMLLEDHQRVIDVALAVGFSSAEYFSRVFGAETGVSPSAYRRGERASA